MTYGSVSFLLMGDANTDAESRIANSGTILQADILKVGHHGSATSSSSAFLSKVHPKTSIIEIRTGNSYGHPTATLGRLVQVGSAVHRTDVNAWKPRFSPWRNETSGPRLLQDVMQNFNTDYS